MIGDKSDGGAKYPPHFRSMVVVHLNRMSALELDPTTDTDEVLHNGVLWLYDIARPILERNREWAQRWNNATPTRSERVDEADDDDSHPQDAGDDGGGSPTQQPTPIPGHVTQGVRRRQRRVLVGALMDAGVLRVESIQPAALDRLDEDATLFDLADVEPTPGVQESSVPDWKRGQADASEPLG